MAELSRRQVPEHVVANSSTIPAHVARRVALVVFDVDGVLTDAGVYLGEGADDRPVELKRFDIQDGLGMKMLQYDGIKVAMVSGRTSGATTVRAEELGVDACHQDAGADKLPAVEALLERWKLGWDEVAMLADDLPDLAVYSRVGLPAAVANARPEIRDSALWVSTHRGGHGAAREFAEALLTARGSWDRRVAEYVDSRGGLGDGPAGRVLAEGRE